MDNTVHIDAALDRFLDTFETLKTRTPREENPSHREYRIIQLRWMELTLSLMHSHAQNTLILIDICREDDDEK